MSYRHKHNEANGEGNRDGAGNNFSSNCGAEGETGDVRIDSIRKRRIKNFLLTLFISRGVPMLLGGDEFRRTQRGNNNAYCQDNETSWYDWRDLEGHHELYRFTREMIAFRRAHPIFSTQQFYTEDEMRWFSAVGGLPNWTDPKENSLACELTEHEHSRLYLMFNAGSHAVDFVLPRAPTNTPWHLAVDTARETPQDSFTADTGPRLENPVSYLVAAHSSVILSYR